MGRASGSLVEAFGPFFFASSLTCLAARALRSASSRSSAARALAARSRTSRAARSRAACRRRVEAPGSSANSCLRAAKRSAPGFDLDEFVARPERFPARVGANLRAVDGDRIKADQPFGDQRRHALRQQPIENFDASPPENRRARDSSAARRRRANDRRHRFAPAAPIRAPNPRPRPSLKPQRQQNRGIGGRPSRFALARENLIVKRRKIEAVDETPRRERARWSAGNSPSRSIMSQRNCRRSGRTTRASPSPIRPSHISDERITAQAKGQFLHTLVSGNDR